MLNFLNILLFSLLIENCFALVGVGTYVPFAGSIQTDTKGKKNYTDFMPYICVNQIFPITGNFYIQPEFGYVFPRKEEGDHTRSATFILANVSYRLPTDTFILSGLGTFYHKVTSKATAVDVNNGSGMATFYRPGGSVTAYNSTVNFGVEQLFLKNYSARFEGFILEILSSNRRKFSYTLSANYYF